MTSIQISYRPVSGDLVIQHLQREINTDEDMIRHYEDAIERLRIKITAYENLKKVMVKDTWV